MFKLDLGNAEEQRSNCQHPLAGSWKKQESSRKTFTSALLTTPNPLTVWITTNCKRRGTRDQIANIHWITEKTRVPEKHLFLLYWLSKPLTVWITINWKILKEMGIPDHLTCLLRNLYTGQEATVRTGHGTTDCSKYGKHYIKAVYCHPAYLTYMQSSSWEMLGWMELKLESRLLEEISIPQICRWHHPYGRKWRGTKEPLDEGESGEWKSWLKAQHLEN